MEKYDRFGSLFWFVLGLGIIYGGCKIGVGRLSHPGGGLFILVLGLALSLLAAMIFVGSVAKKMQDARSEIVLWAGLKWEYPIYILVALLLYTFIMPKVGYMPATIFLMVFLFGLFEHHRWKWVIGEAVLAGVLSYFIFGPWLQVRFPRGILEVLAGY